MIHVMLFSMSNVLYCYVSLLLLLLLLLLFVVVDDDDDDDVACQKAFLPGISLEPAVIPTIQASSFRLQYFPCYV